MGFNSGFKGLKHERTRERALKNFDTGNDEEKLKNNKHFRDG